MNINQKKCYGCAVWAVLLFVAGLQGFAADPLPPRIPAAVYIPATGKGMGHPETRRAAVEQLRQAEEDRRAKVRAWAVQRGLPLREVKPGGGARELMDVDGEQPLYYTTCNANAGISSGANRLWAAPYGVNGSSGNVRGERVQCNLDQYDTKYGKPSWQDRGVVRQQQWF